MVFDIMCFRGTKKSYRLGTLFLEIILLGELLL